MTGEQLDVILKTLGAKSDKDGWQGLSDGNTMGLMSPTKARASRSLALKLSVAKGSSSSRAAPSARCMPLLALTYSLSRSTVKGLQRRQAGGLVSVDMASVGPLSTINKS